MVSLGHPKFGTWCPLKIWLGCQIYGLVLTPLLCMHVIRYTYICDEESQTFQLHINEFEHLFLFMYVAIWLDFLFLCRGSEQKSVNFNFVFNLSFFIGDECLKCFVGVCYYSF